MTRRATLIALVIVALVSVGAAVATRDEPSRVSRAEQVDSTAPRFRTLGTLVAATDEVVLAEVIDVVSGRTISDPANPAASITTTLARLRVVETLKGSPPDEVILEQEAALANGRPIEVDGVPPVKAGERGVFFLILSLDTAVPFRAVVGPEGRYLVEGDALTASIDTALTRRIVRAGGPALIRAVRSAQETQPAPR